MRGHNKWHVEKKTLSEKEKLLVTSNFFFSHNVFHSYISVVRQNAALCGNGLQDEANFFISYPVNNENSPVVIPWVNPLPDNKF